MIAGTFVAIERLPLRLCEIPAVSVYVLIVIILRGDLCGLLNLKGA